MTTRSPFSFNLTNTWSGDAPVSGVVYADPHRQRANKLVLEVTCTAECYLPAQSGVPPALSPNIDGKSNGTLIYVDLRELFTPEQFKINAFKIEQSDGRWNIDAAASQGQQTICLYPNKNFRLAPGEQPCMRIGLPDLVLTDHDVGEKPKLTVPVILFGFNAAGHPLISHIEATVAMAADAKEHLPNYLRLGLVPSDVTNGVTCTLGLLLLPGDYHMKIPSGKDTKLTLILPASESGNLPGDLTSTENAKKVMVTKQSKEDEWSCSSANEIAGNVTFNLTPKSDNPILCDPASNTPLQFSIGNLIPTGSVGEALIRLKYTNVAGFTDGEFSLPLRKSNPRPRIEWFTVEFIDNKIDEEKGTANAKFKWEVVGKPAPLLEIQYDVLTQKRPEPINLTPNTKEHTGLITYYWRNITLVAKDPTTGVVIDHKTAEIVWPIIDKLKVKTGASVNGELITNTATVNGKLTATGLLTVNGGVDVKGGAVLKGALTAFGQYVKMPLTVVNGWDDMTNVPTWVAETDGYLIASIGIEPEGHAVNWYWNATQVYIFVKTWSTDKDKDSTNALNAFVSGGNTCTSVQHGNGQVEDWKWHQAVMSRPRIESICVPIPKGNSVQARMYLRDWQNGRPVADWTNCWWLPIGNGSLK